MKSIEIRKEIKTLIAEKLGMENIEDEQILFGVAGGFDSLSLLTFVLDLESKFDVVIADDDLIPENFSSINNIANYIAEIVN